MSPDGSGQFLPEPNDFVSNLCGYRYRKSLASPSQAFQSLPRLLMYYFIAIIFSSDIKGSKHYKQIEDSNNPLKQVLKFYYTSRVSYFSPFISLWHEVNVVDFSRSFFSCVPEMSCSTVYFTSSILLRDSLVSRKIMVLQIKSIYFLHISVPVFRVGIWKVLCYLCFPVSFVKSAISVFHLVTAAQSIVEIDTSERSKPKSG